MSISLSLFHANPLSNPVLHPLARAATAYMDRRAHPDRRLPLKAMPAVERSWTRHVVVAGCVGALLGSTAAFYLPGQRQAPSDKWTAATAQLELLVPAAAVMAPLFDTAPFVTKAPFVSESLSKTQGEASPSTESYSEDAAGVPSATLHEPPKSPLSDSAR